MGQVTGRVRAFAHRGGALHPDLVGLENTLRAFRHAHALGFRHLETDVHLTADGVLVAFHDTVLDRVTDGTGRVSAVTLAGLRTARVGGREPVPTLVELLDALPDTVVNVDLKDDRAVAPLARLLAVRGDEDRVVVGSFSARRLRRFRRLTRGRVATSAHAVEVAAYRLLPSAGLLRLLVRGRPTALQVPERAGPLRVVTPGLVRRAHAAGVEVHVWVVDAEDRMRALLEAGVDGLMTDRTDILARVMRDVGPWPTP
ncbi:glycerophosphodiester phosphodiesterase family protein [uncultured Nocardioides sp.]|uniref:glycerophosphodiester phosphodiesterase family protein n=1 Tax=uncultured Nocardioides sp. TaxID=198441 RepID=UPI00261BEE32|nr:glycerophosphodiester phosphodiesterase family protein [uncultured Nocardioides sp.]